MNKKRAPFGFKDLCTFMHMPTGKMSVAVVVGYWCIDAQANGFIMPENALSSEELSSLVYSKGTHHKGEFTFVIGKDPSLLTSKQLRAQDIQGYILMCSSPEGTVAFRYSLFYSSMLSLLTNQKGARNTNT